MLNYAFCTPDERRFVDELHLGHLLAAELEPRKTFRQEENRRSTLLLRGPRREPVNNHTSVAVQVFQGYLYNIQLIIGYNANLGVVAEMVFCCQFQKLGCNGVEMRIFYR